MEASVEESKEYFYFLQVGYGVLRDCSYEKIFF